MIKRAKPAIEDGEVDYGGVVCTSPLCDWSSGDPEQERCSSCGSWTRMWITNVKSMIPPGARWRVLPPPPEEH